MTASRDNEPHVPLRWTASPQGVHYTGSKNDCLPFWPYRREDQLRVCEDTDQVQELYSGGEQENKAVHHAQLSGG